MTMLRLSSSGTEEDAALANDNAAPAKAAAARSSEKEGQSTRESCSSF